MSVYAEKETGEEVVPSTINLVYDDYAEVLLGATKELSVSATSTVPGAKHLLISGTRISRIRKRQY